MSASLVSSRQGRAKPILLFAVLIVLVIAATWLWMLPSTQPSLETGRAVAEAFLNNLREGHPEKAWESTTAEFKSAQGRESFLRDVKPQKFLTEKLDFVSAQTVTVQEQPRTEYLFRAPTSQTVRIVLGKENGQWKVDLWVR